ncbi:MAG: proline--tRNA ligase [Candidatus Bathyarchaeia archaeon]
MTVSRKRWSAHFNEWFHEIIDKAGIIDYRYPVKGCGVWLPYGFNLRQRVTDTLRSLLNENNHEEVLFPTLITSDMLRNEAEHIRSFGEQTFWITRGGGKDLEEDYALRPTSETALAPMLKLWIRSHADLPKKLYQIVSIFRYETKATRPLIRLREVSTFKEAHTSHATLKEAEDTVEEAVRIYGEFFDALCVPYIVSRRPDWDKFAGALVTKAYDTVFPDGRILQIGTVHNLGQNFSQSFDISFETADGKRDHVYQTSYGISERAIAAVISIHGDDSGLVLPPNVAPIQIVIVPIPYKDLEHQIVEQCKKLQELLVNEGYRVTVDWRDKLTPGSKFYEWESKGVPIRIELGPRDLRDGTVTLVRRDTAQKTASPLTEISKNIRNLFEDIHRSLKSRAAEWLRSHAKNASSLEDARNVLQSQAGIVEIPWCGKEACGLTAQESTNGAALGVPVDEPLQQTTSRCAVCSQKASSTLRLGKTY